MIKPDYLNAIAYFYPSISAVCVGSPHEYENISIEQEHESSSTDQELPSKEDLDEKILSLIRDELWLEIQEERTRRQYGGVFVADVNKWFHSDEKSRSQHLALTIMPEIPPGIMWKSMDGSFIEMTSTLAKKIFSALVTLDVTTFAVAEVHKSAVYASSDPMSYDFSQGWPTIYEQ
jgi:hypothetical protein